MQECVYQKRAVQDVEELKQSWSLTNPLQQRSDIDEATEHARSY